MLREPKPYEVYRHFKGNLYQIVAVALDSEDGSKQVVYQQLYSPFLVYVRPYDMFLSEVDHDKYPEVTQKYRFEKVELLKKNENDAVAGNAEVQAIIEQQEMIAQEMPKDSEDSEELNPKLLEFLDASTFAARLRVLESMKNEITHEIINTISAALELKIEDGDLEHRYEDLKDCLAVYEKYECNRLR